MRTKRFIPISLLAAVAVFGWSSCSKIDSAGPSGNHTPDKVEDLSVPAGFSWKTMAEVRCNFTSGHDARVYLSQSEKAEPFAAFIVGGDNDPVTLSLPVSAKTIYVKYETETGFSAAQALSVTGNTLAYAVPADSKPYTGEAALMAMKAKDEGISQEDKDNGYIGIPANGWGTLMFEDLWSSYGDYDFNDLVVGYKIQAYLQNKHNSNKNQVREIQVGLIVRAVGGTLPYKFYLAMTGVKGGEIDEIELLQNDNGAETVDMVHLNPGNSVKEPAMFLFTDIEKNAHKPQGAAYINTVKGSEMPESDLVKVSFFITLRNAVAVEQFTADKFDFFIAREKGEENPAKEIHLRGYAPLLYGESNYDEIKASSPVIRESKEYFASNTNLVWAINIPTSIPHAYENVDFLKAYPNFATWAQSGGTEHADWYENKPGNRESSNLVEVK